MNPTRQQLTLFLDPGEAASIEYIRQTYNPVQYQLIKSHITLCREDEIQPLDQVLANLADLTYHAFRLSLGAPTRFSEGKGVYLPIEDEQHAFNQLRASVLAGIYTVPRDHEPHITLMHPRNSTCDDKIFSEIQAIALPATVGISTISLIEQEVGKEWQVLKEFGLYKI